MLISLVLVLIVIVLFFESSFSSSEISTEEFNRIRRINPAVC